ncbi:beta-lactamase family protein [Bradyrhizobium sp. Pear76]|uniref:serine hydrolase domain-containing protein n=1 Tax=Bradyrhizobium oropedii TaxID=1571201 RepID=UPI001E36D542|nr:serine hydrolase domain-containing protein [Bradyrhizobium oropedii]MCC8967088.1 beta-lactamase family protein [Bradyrhizobium oropedii]
MTAALELSGSCLPAFTRVRDVFLANFREHNEVGADFALYVGGELVVELWSGFRDEAGTTPWARDTIANVFSAAKGLNGACYAMAVDRGLASYEDKVSDHWPEFAAGGKQDITLGQLLSHQSGICGFADPATIEDLLAGERSAARLAAQTPLWEPGTACGYNTLSSGIIFTALFRRITGMSIKQFVAENIAAPLQLDLSIGVPPDQRGRIAPVIAGADQSSAGAQAPSIYQTLANMNPQITGSIANTEAWKDADLPSANGFANGKGLASFYNALIVPNSPLVSRQTLAEATRPRIEGIDLVRQAPQRWSAGFWLNPNKLSYGPNDEAFGHSGWGGSFAFADPVAGVAVGYVMNRMTMLADRDPRRRNLIDTLYTCL